MLSEVLPRAFHGRCSMYSKTLGRTVQYGVHSCVASSCKVEAVWLDSPQIIHDLSPIAPRKPIKHHYRSNYSCK